MLTTRLAALARLGARGRWRAIGSALSTSTFPPALFRRCGLIIFALRDMVPPAGNAEDLSVRPADDADIPALLALRPGNVLYRSSLRREERCFLGTIGDDLAVVTHVKVGPWHRSRHEAYRFALRPGEAWAYGGFVGPRFRGRKLLHHQWYRAWAHLRTEGFHTLYCSIQKGNEASLRVHDRMGYTPIYDLSIFRLLGITWLSVRTAGPSAVTIHRRFGWWNEDPERRPAPAGRSHPGADAGTERSV